MHDDSISTTPKNSPSETESRHSRGLVGLGAEYARMASEATRELPGWFRPMAITFVYAFGLLMVIVAVPIALVMVPELRRYLLLDRSVSGHVRRVWLEESPQEALRIARRVFGEVVRAYPHRVRIPPYGSASSKWALDSVGHLLFSSYVALDEWERALGVAETVLDLKGDEGDWQWEVSKARALRATGRPLQARRLLEALLGKKNAAVEARRVLDSWNREETATAKR